MAEPDDPVREGLGDSEDLYDVATWDERTALDRLSVQVHRALDTVRSWVPIALAIVLFVGLFGLAVLVVADQPVLGVLGLVSILPALILMGYLWLGDPTTREPFDALAITFVLSILFATFAALVNTLLSPIVVFVPGIAGFGLYFFLVVGPVEETVKWLSIRVHAYGRPSFQTVVDGVVYGAVAGLGFAAIENLLYISDAYLGVADAATSQVQLSEAASTAVSRAFVGPGHVLFSAIAGYYLGLAKFNPGRRGPIVVKGLLIAAGLHGFYNTAVTWGQTAGLLTGPVFIAFVLVFDGLLLVFLLRKVSRYESYYRRVQTGGTAQPGATPRQRSGPED